MNAKPIVLGVVAAALCAAPTAASADDYALHHPRLLFTPGELPAMRARVTDGGDDDDAYAYISALAGAVYPGYPGVGTTGPGYGLETLPNLAIAGWLAAPVDTAALGVGRALTLMVAREGDVNFDEANAALRLRALALGYDMFFANASGSERAEIRDEIEEYLALITSSLAYELFEYPPYLANHSAMLAAALGLAAISLWDEGDATLVSDALAMADRICDNLIARQFGERGGYGEGAFYALWTMKHLVYYFDARLRFDGYDYSTRTRVRALEQWLAYELLPEGSARSLNLGDSAWYSRPFAIYPSYFSWATDRWDSGLSAWIWEHAAGTWGVTMSAEADRAATVLWWRPVAPVHPSSLLPKRRLFTGPGLYHYRTGWQTGAASDDLVFAFRSGTFHGGHAQEDQNQFVLHGYGAHFVVDHGPGDAMARHSEAHNMVFVDGAGQHNAGASIGTDGNIAECMMTGFADYVFGDATSAYGTYSPLNSPNHPVAGVDWSWGYIGANPVERAHRRVLAVDDGTLPPYFVVVDDIRKDDGTHAWQWRMHTQDAYTVDTSGNPLRVLAPTATLDIHVLRPEAFTVATTPFDNLNLEANSTLLSLDYAGVEPDYTVILVPSPGGETPPTVARTSAPWGAAATIDFGDGDVDVLICNDDGETVSHAGVTTDARIALVRLSGSTPLHYLAVDMTTLSVGGDLYAEMRDAPASCAQSGQTLHVGRYDADFRFRDTGATEVRYQEQALGFVDDGGGFLVSDQVTAASDAPSPAARLSLEAWPNPFNPDVSIRIEASGGGVVALAVYDVAGRRVRDLWRGPVDGARTVAWDGRNDAGHRVASGTYFAVATTPTARYVARVTLVK